MTRDDPSSVYKRVSARETRMEAVRKRWMDQQLEAGETSRQRAANDQDFCQHFEATQILIFLAKARKERILSDGILLLITKQNIQVQ